MDYSEIIPIVLLFPAIGLLCVLAHKKRHKFPRSVLFFYCFLPFALGIGLLISTYLDFSHDQVMPILLKGKATINKLQSPKVFWVGVTTNILFYLCFAVGGFVGMLMAVINANFRFKE
ncbi:MAG: hypothetical protein WA123_11005 [Methylotenera sp.]